MLKLLDCTSHLQQPKGTVTQDVSRRALRLRERQPDAAAPRALFHGLLDGLHGSLSKLSGGDVHQTVGVESRWAALHPVEEMSALPAEAAASAGRLLLAAARAALIELGVCAAANVPDQSTQDVQRRRGLQ